MMKVAASRISRTDGTFEIVVTAVSVIAVLIVSVFII